MRKLLAALLVMAGATASAQVVIQTSATVSNANDKPSGINLGGATSYWDFPQKNLMMYGGNPGFENPQFRQIFADAIGGNYSASYVQANLSNTQYDGAPLNYFATNNAVLTVTSPGTNYGVSRTITGNTQASTVEAGTISNMVLSLGTITVTFAKTSGANQNTGTVIPLTIAGVTGGTGTINRLVTNATVISNTSFSYPAAGEDPTGASFASATMTAAQGVLYSFSTPFPAAFAVSDRFNISWTTAPTAQVHTTGAAVQSYESSDICLASQTVDWIRGGQGPGCGAQAYKCDSTVSGTCFIQYTLDNTTTQNFLLQNGTYTRAFMAKLVSGSGTVAFQVGRLGGTQYTYTVTPTGTWTQYSSPLALAEVQTSPGLGALIITVTMTGGVIELDNLVYGSTGGDVTNTSAFRDEVVSALRDYLKPGSLRDWHGGGQNGITTANWAKDMLTQAPSAAGLNQVYGFASVDWSVHDFLKLAQTIGNGAIPFITVPGTSTEADWQYLSDALWGGAGTAGGADRIAAGGPSAAGGWATVFSEIDLEDANESWNSLNVAQAWGFRSGSCNIYCDYAAAAGQHFAAMRGMPSFQSTNVKLMTGAQTALNPSDSVYLATTSKANVVTLAGYYQNHIEATYSSGAATQALVSAYQPALSDSWAMTNYINDQEGFRGQLNAIFASTAFGAGANQPGDARVYEENWGTGNSGCNQPCMDTTAPTRVGLLTAANQVFENLEAGVNIQNGFTMTQYSFSPNTFNFKGWGFYTDMGGQLSKLNAATFGGTRNPRPTAIGIEMANSCIAVGTMRTVTTTGNTFYTPINTLFNAPITSISGTGTITFTFGTPTAGAIPPVGTQTTIVTSNVIGGTGILGTLYAAVITSSTTATYTAAGADSTGYSLGALPTIKSGGNEVVCVGCSTPTIRPDIFQTGTSTCLAVRNTDPVNSYTVTFTGPLAPTGTVNLLRSNSGGAATDRNEAASTNTTNTWAAQVFATQSTLSSFNPATPFTIDPLSLYVFSFNTAAVSGSNTATQGPVVKSGKIANQ